MDNYEVLKDQLMFGESEENGAKLVASFDSLVSAARTIKEAYKSSTSIVEKEALAEAYKAIENYFDAASSLIIATRWLNMVEANSILKHFEG